MMVTDDDINAVVPASAYRFILAYTAINGDKKRDVLFHSRVYAFNRQAIAFRKAVIDIIGDLSPLLFQKKQEQCGSGCTINIIIAITDFYGDDPRLSPDYPRIVNIEQFQRLENILAGSLVWSGGKSDPGERYISPTILRGVTLTSSVMQSEIFGPLLPVIAYGELSEALDIIRSEDAPLALYLFSSDQDVQDRVVRDSRSGGVCINDLLFQAAIPGLPFGGLGKSGFGAYHGKAGFDTFSFQRSVLRRPLYPDPGLRYPPYSWWKFMLLKRLVTFFQ